MSTADRTRSRPGPASNRARRRADDAPEGHDPSGWLNGRIGSVEVLAAFLILMVVLRDPLARMLSGRGVQTWATVFVSVLVQAVPFLVFGVVLSAVIAVYVPRSFWARALPRHPALAVPAAGLAGVVLPGCECGSVPIAGSLIRRGVTPAAALAFLLAAPAINPIVLTATAIAFPANPEMVVARGGASLVVAVVMGWLWLRLGKAEWIRLPRRPGADGLSQGRALVFLVVGPMVDLKLISMQAGVFGRRFMTRFAPATFLLGIVVAVSTAAVLL